MSVAQVYAPIEINSTDILVVGWEPKREFKRVADEWVVIPGGFHDRNHSWYGLSALTEGYILYVRFPEGSVLTGKAADVDFHGQTVYGRAFRARPVAIRLEQPKGE